jgi:hypothetical protein
MKPRFVLTLGLLFGASSTALAQSPNCPGGPLGSRQLTSQDACQKTVDLFEYMAPQLGGAITGGNATLGQGGALGFGHFSVGLRINLLQGSVPQLTQANAIPVPTGAVATVYNTDDTPIPMPTADGAVGVFSGIPFGLTNVLAVDGLLSASYVPKVTQSNVSIDPDNPLKLGYGFRVGIIQESIVTPAVALTYLRRDLPALGITGNASGATLRLTDFDETTQAWRFVLSKSLATFGATLGIGQDQYHSQARAAATALTFTSDTVNVVQKMTRTNVFGDLAFNVPFLKFVLEVGEITAGGDPNTFNTFTGRGIVDPRWYGSIGARFAF